MAIAAMYLRFSSKNQGDQSLDTQEHKVREVAVNQGNQVDWVFADRDESGKSADREQFMEMYRLRKSGKINFSILYVYKYSRFMRNEKESAFFKSRLRALGVEVISALEPMP